jgi:hypothetical protein
MPALPLRVSHFVSSECKLTECKLRRPRRRPVAGRHAAMQQQGRRRPWLWLYHISCHRRPCARQLGARLVGGGQHEGVGLGMDLPRRNTAE